MDKMEIDLGNLKRYSIKDLELADEDLQAIMTVGFTASGTFLNLLKLRKQIECLEPDIRVIYSTISSTNLRVVKKEDWEEYNNWRKKKGMTSIPDLQ